MRIFLPGILPFCCLTWIYWIKIFFLSGLSWWSYSSSPLIIRHRKLLLTTNERRMLIYCIDVFLCGKQNFPIAFRHLRAVEWWIFKHLAASRVGCVASSPTGFSSFLVFFGFKFQVLLSYTDNNRTSLPVIKFLGLECSSSNSPFWNLLNQFWAAKKKKMQSAALPQTLSYHFMFIIEEQKATTNMNLSGLHD